MVVASVTGNRGNHVSGHDLASGLATQGNLGISPAAGRLKRGADGKGKYALKCANCHQDTNLPGANMPPGNPTWHLPR
jgi:hypothetical protein